MTHPHINMSWQVSVGNILTIVAMAVALLGQAMWLGSVTSAFNLRLEAEERSTAKYQPIVDGLQKDQGSNEQRLTAGEIVRKERVPQLDNLSQLIGRNNDRINAIDKANDDTVKIIRELAAEVGKLQVAVAKLNGELERRPKP